MNERDFIDSSSGHTWVLRQPRSVLTRPVTIDRASATVLTPRFAWGHRRQALSSLRHVCIRARHTRYGTYYSTVLIAEGWKTVVWVLSRYPDVRLLSERLAAELSVPLVDESMGEPQLRAPDQLDTPVGDRAGRDIRSRSLSQRPASMHCQVSRDGGVLIIEAPPSSTVSIWVKGLLFGLVLLPLLVLSVVTALTLPGLFWVLWAVFGAITLAVTIDIAHARVIWRVNATGLRHCRLSPVSRRETFLSADSIEELFSIHRPSLRQQMGGRDTRHVGVVVRGDQCIQLLPVFDAHEFELDYLVAEAVAALGRNR